MPCKDEPVRVERKRFGFWPEVFIWRGRRLHAHQVQRCWTAAWGTGTQRCERRYFRLHCEGGAVVLYHDVLANLWWLDPGLSFRPSPAGRLGLAIGRFRRALGAALTARTAPQHSILHNTVRGGC